jgi:xanthine dehydrogenase accessory factor
METYDEMMSDPWSLALESVRGGRRAVLVFVVDHSGSVPGVTGTRAVVSDLGIAGTIGGGAAEKQLLEQAREHTGDPQIVRFRHTPGEGGTLCSGLQIFAVMQLSAEHEAPLASLVDTLSNHRTGTLGISPAGLRFSPGAASPHLFAEVGDTWDYSGPVGLLDTLTIVGGGHVSLAFSRVMATLPFRIVVLDNRDELPTMEANRYAHERRVVDYEELGNHVPEGDRSWVTIMTYGHNHDRLALERLLDKDLAYLGVLGSKAKIHQMFSAMKNDGVRESALDGVRAPVGISIGSHTPEEIAVSIAAEIVAVRNGRD